MGDGEGRDEGGNTSDEVVVADIDVERIKSVENFSHQHLKVSLSRSSSLLNVSDRVVDNVNSSTFIVSVFVNQAFKVTLTKGITRLQFLICYAVVALF